MVAVVIDDEILVAERTSRLLRDAGFIVYCYTNPLQALEAEEVKSADVLYLDIEMPEVSGLNIARQIHDINMNCEVVFITGHNEFAVEAFDVNALDYLLKPLTKAQVDRSIERIQKRRGINEEVKDKKDITNRRISISLFGKTLVYTNDGSKSLRFVTTKGAEVFCFMLLQKSGIEVSKWKLIDEIWSDKDVSKGDINLRSTISRLNKTFRDNGILISLKSTRNGYQLEVSSEVDVEVDVFLLEEIANKNYLINEDNLISYEIILLHYNDMLLEDFDSEWCTIYRTLYHRYFKIAAQKLTAYYKKVQQNPIRIMSIIESIIKYEPYDDEIREMALNLTYQIYGKLEAKNYYKDYINLIKHDLDMKPGSKLKEYYRLLMQDS